MLENIGGTELLVVLIVIFIFFGPKKLPEFGKTIGKGVKEFQNAMRDVRKDIDNAARGDEK